MSLKHGLLGLLNYGNMTGYDIDRTFKDSLFYSGRRRQAKFTGS